MPITNFPGGASSFGNILTGLSPQIPIPVLSQQFNQGQVFFVDGTNGSDSNAGNDPSAAFATLQAAFDAVTSAKGATIYIYPGTYAENATCDADYVALIGAFAGRYGYPDLVGNAGTALTVTGQGFFASRLRLATDTGTNPAVIQQGNGFKYFNCIFDGDGNTGALVQLLPNLDDDSYTASEGEIYDSWFRGSGGIGLEFKNPGPGVEGGVGPTDNLIHYCRFVNNTSQDIKDTDTAGSNDTCFLRSIVRNCDFMDQNKAVYITLTNGGNNTGSLDQLYFAMDGAGRLTNVQVALAAGIVATNLNDATGIVDSHTF